VGAAGRAISRPAAFTRRRYDRYGACGFVVLSLRSTRSPTAFACYRRNPREGEPVQRHVFLVSQEGKVVVGHRGEEPFTPGRTLLVAIDRL